MPRTASEDMRQMPMPGAIAKVFLADDRDPVGRCLTALFNPTELVLAVNARIGRLNPIGWSSDTKQYASTESPSFSLTFEFSYEAFSNFGMLATYPDFHYAHRFFMSFCQGPRMGIAPSHMRIIWPNTLAMICVVESVQVSFRRFYQYLNASDYAITVQLAENSMDFLSSDDVITKGFQRLPSNSSRRGASSAHADTGKPLRITAPIGIRTK